MARFAPGQSGNPKGRKPGTRCKATQAAEALLAGEAKALTRRAIQMAMGGDVQALRICMDRVAPIRKATVRFDLPSLADLPAAIAAVAEQAAAGVISVEEASHIGTLLELHRRAVETAELETRIARLEAKHGP